MALPTWVPQSFDPLPEWVIYIHNGYTLQEQVVILQTQ